jgi:hypothetical protein
MTHRIYIIFLTLVILLTFIGINYKGLSFYAVSLEERFYHPDYATLKPSGTLGHGYGIIGSLFMVIGVLLYSARKRLRVFLHWGILKHWLEFHIFLCTLGPLLVLYHTSFKFGGIVAVSFWSMVAVFLSGVIGRVIYIQIPRSIEGQELSLNEINAMKKNINDELTESHKLDEESRSIITELTRKKVEKYHKNPLTRWIRNSMADRKKIRGIKSVLNKNKIPRLEYNKILKIARQDILLNRRIERLVTMQNLFKYWHVAHLPFALVMLIIMIIHTVVTIVFGYHWIF